MDDEFALRETAGVPSDFSVPVLNNRGQIAFASRLRTPERMGPRFTTSHRALFRTAADGQIELVTSTAQPVLENDYFERHSLEVRHQRAFEDLRINDAGQVAFGVALSGPSFPDENASSVWRAEANGELSPLVVAGDPAPSGFEGVRFTNRDFELFDSHPFDSLNPFNQLQLDNAGVVAFSAGISDSRYPERTRFWTGSDRSGLRPVGLSASESGDLYPDPSSRPIRSAYQHFDMAPQGQLVYRDVYGLFDSPQRAALFYEPQAGQRVEIVRQGDLRSMLTGEPAPTGLDALDPAFGALETRELSQTLRIAPGGGAVVFEAYMSFPGGLVGPGVTELPANRHTLWRWRADSGAADVAAEVFGPAPGTEGAIFAPAGPFENPRSTFEEVQIDRRGRVAFRSETTGFGRIGEGIWSEGLDGELSLIAMQGDPAPGLDGRQFAWFDDFQMNAAGQVALLGYVEGRDDAGARADTFGIWAQDLSGELKLIAYNGSLIDVDLDPSVEDLRGLLLVESRRDEPLSFAFNDLGEIAFRARVQDDTGRLREAVLVSSTVALPEPTAFGLLLLGSIGVPCLARTKRTQGAV